jgi:Uroporphyrinogen-III synthase
MSMVKSVTLKESKVKTKATKSISKSISTILITQPKPESDKSPYYDLAKKYNVELDFSPFIHVEGISAKDFRKQNISINDYTAVIFNSRNAIDHFFRLAEELRIKISPEMKYFCITEAISLYLQKFILYRKRKIFFGEDGTVQSMLDVIAKHKYKEKYFVPVNDICRAETLDCLKKNNLEYGEGLLYKTVCADVREVIEKHHDMIVFFTPGGVRSLFENKPDYKQNGTYLAAFGPITTKAVEDAGLTLHLKAPMPGAPSMVAALDLFLAEKQKKSK